jgi:hypothetical protein
MEDGMMKAIRLVFGLVVLAITPVAAFAQAGVTPLAADPFPLDKNQNEFRGYVTIEDDFDLFGVFRRGIGDDFDFGARFGYTDAADGGIHIGGDLRWGLARSERREEAGLSGEELPVSFAVVAGIQVSFADLGSLIAVPIGVSIGKEVGNEERSVVLYGIPFLQIYSVYPDGFDSETDLEFGIELGADVEISGPWIGSADLTIASHDDDNISLALGVIYRR